MIGLRLATMADADDLLRWRNDPAVLAAFRSNRPVSIEEHVQWMRLKVRDGYPTHIVMIGDGRRLGKTGVVRFHAAADDPMRFEVSIAVEPMLRGAGVGKVMLATGCKIMDKMMGGCVLDAEIRVGNKASRRIFEVCGFERVGARDGFVHYRREAQ